MAEVAVVGASPLIYLAKAGHLDLLRLASGRVVVPAAVANEVERHPVDAAVRALRDTPWLSVSEPTAIPPAVLAWDLGPGESAVLGAGPGRTQRGGGARRSCRATLRPELPGCGARQRRAVLLARQRGVVPSARAVLERLRQVVMYLSDTTLDEALRLVGEA